MPNEALIRIAQRLLDADVRWVVVELNEQAGSARLAPLWASPAVMFALDQEFGPEGWWLEAGAVAGGTYVSVSFGAHRRSVIATAPRFDLSVDPLTGEQPSGLIDNIKTAWLHTVALEAMQVPLEVAVEDDGWVVWENGRPNSPLPAVNAELREWHEEPAALSPDAAAAQPVDAAPQEAPSEPVKSEGQQAIDRLVERLRGEGYGSEVARIITSYGGYGTTPEQSRALYGELRALLKRQQDEELSEAS
jgi:hypothetical protein